MRKAELDPPVLQTGEQEVSTMMFDACPNDIEDAPSRRQIPLAPLPSFSHL